RREQWQQARLPAHVAARLGALRDHEIAARGLGGDRLVERSDLPAHERTERVSLVDERALGLAIEELDDPRAARRDRDARWIEERHQEVHTERAGSRLRDALELRIQELRRI